MNKQNGYTLIEQLLLFSVVLLFISYLLLVDKCLSHVSNEVNDDEYYQQAYE